LSAARAKLRIALRSIAYIILHVEGPCQANQYCEGKIISADEDQDDTMTSQQRNSANYLMMAGKKLSFDIQQALHKQICASQNQPEL
jgi:hypothetical protein